MPIIPWSMPRNAQNRCVLHVNPTRASLAKTFGSENCDSLEPIQSLQFSMLSWSRFGSFAGSASCASLPLPITPTFVLPYKRYASNQLLNLANRHLDSDRLSLRNAASVRGNSIGYESQDHALSHTTLWRFLTCLGSMTCSLAIGTDLFLNAFPESDIHRFTGTCSPLKFRSEFRAQTLRIANRLLKLILRWDTAFPKERFFPRFATKARAP